MKLREAAGQVVAGLLLCGGIASLIVFGSRGYAREQWASLVRPAPGTEKTIEDALKGEDVSCDTDSNSAIKVPASERSRALQAVSRLKVIPLPMALASLGMWRARGTNRIDEMSMQLDVSWAKLSPVLTLHPTAPKQQWSLTLDYSNGSLQVARHGPMTIPKPFTVKALAVSFMFLAKKGDLVPFQVNISKAGRGYSLDFFKLPHPPGHMWARLVIAGKGYVKEDLTGEAVP